MTRLLGLILLGLLVVLLYAETASSKPGDPCRKCDCSDRIWVSDIKDPILFYNLKTWKIKTDAGWQEATQAYTDLWTHDKAHCAAGVRTDNATEIRRWVSWNGKIACDPIGTGASVPFEAYTGSVADDANEDQYICEVPP